MKFSVGDKVKLLTNGGYIGTTRQEGCIVTLVRKHEDRDGIWFFDDGQGKGWTVKEDNIAHLTPLDKLL